MKQQLGVEARSEDAPAPRRYVLLQRTVTEAVRRTRERAPLGQQVRGWAVVIAIFLAALACWGVVIGTLVGIAHLI